jgi:hypothetical protein
MASVKLKVLNVQDYSTTIGRSTQDYSTFNCATPNDETVLIAVTHNALKRKAGIDDCSSADLLIGCTLIAQDSVTDQGVVEEADVNIQKVLDGTWNVMVLNSRNCSIIKTENFNAEIRDLQAKVKAKVLIEREKESKLAAQKRAEERFNAKMAAKIAALNAPPKEEEPQEEVQPVNETEEEPQF